MRHLARGASTKVIALELGVSISTVAVYIERAMAKLGADSRIGVILHGSEAIRWPSSMTEAERFVASRALEGKSNAEIAVERRRSVRTVAKQVASAFRKLGVGSRFELAALLREPGTSAPRVDTCDPCDT